MLYINTTLMQFRLSIFFCWNKHQFLNTSHTTREAHFCKFCLKLSSANITLLTNFLFPNIVIAIQIFCTIPVTVAEAERTFSKLKQIKSVQRSVMKQDRLNGLATLAIEHDLAKLLNYDDIINDFASAKSRKVCFWNNGIKYYRGLPLKHKFKIQFFQTTTE